MHSGTADLDLRKLRVLRELAERGTVSAVAEALHLTPSAVSQQLSALARETGVRLLEPAGRRVRLTGAARVLLRHADELFARLERVQADLAAFQDGASGEVRVTAFSSAITGLVLPALRELRETSPGLALTLCESEVPGAYTGLVHGETDLVIAVVAPGDPPADDARFARVSLLADPLDVMLHADHPRAKERALDLADLVDEVWVTGSSGSCSKLTATACASVGYAPRVVHRADEWTTVFGLVEAGLGISLVPRLVTSRIAAPPPGERGVVIRELTGAPPMRHITVFVRNGAERAPHIAAVLDALTRQAERVRGGRPLSVVAGGA
ncbi:LysR family transcriptional regulator [Yinghuangia seranimata]|uniref:LysR family transcriptional regulator n=1 Tax=Yinghuangia seranimata TaxID=408067 RepID=UPI00248C3FDE|nr:LysR family transcriptional regulator [Yinghuangia seranimata]MDI2126524.1 LysR family transcriptional regulator [Yinghuangia seranimata]